MEYLLPILTVAGIHILSVMSPGPDFLLVAKNSMVHSRTAGIYSSLGIALGLATQITLCLAGIGILIAQSVVIFTVIKLMGAAYLIYIGVKALRSKRVADHLANGPHTDISKKAAFRMGFLTNITNPKCMLFVLSLFSLVIAPDTPLIVKLIMTLEMTIANILWFNTVSYLVTHRLVRRRFAAAQHRVEQVMGGLLVLLGIKVALSHTK